MTIKQLDNVQKKDSFLYYRNEYSADAFFEFGNNSGIEKARVEFSIEKTAIGETRINVNISTQINYPILPAIKELKKYVVEKQAEGMFA